MNCQTSTYESTLNTWLAAVLRERGLDARAESGQGGGKRLDVEIWLDGLKIALEAEQGFSTAKKASAIKDADSRLRDDLADCAVAICYPEGLRSAAELAECELLHTLRSHKERPPAKKTAWKQDSIAQLVSVIRKIPDQLGDPDEIANRLSFSLDRAVARLNESQKQDLAACLDLPAGKPTKIESDCALSSRFNQAAKRAMLVIATAVMFHSQLDKHRHKIKPRAFEGPASASRCANSDDPVGAFYVAWELWLAVDYKPIFATARNALQVLAGSHEFTAAVQVVARASLQVTRNIVGLRHDLLGRIFHKVLDTARYDGSFYTTTAAATLLANLAIREDMLDWSDSAAIAGLRITDPACGTGTLLMAAAERIRDLTSAVGNQGRDSDVSRLLIENVLTGYDVNLTATHLAATTLGLLSPTTTFGNMKIYRALLGVDENNEVKLGSLEFLDTGKAGQPRLLPWPTGVEQIETREESAAAEPADLVIMNPPFTRDSLRHDQFSRAEEKKLKAREKEIFDRLEGGIHRSHNGGGFLALADKIAKSQSGTIAVVLPLVGATNYATREMRIHLAKKFHIDTIVTSHDPTRIYFSENTNIGEMLLICRRKAPTPNPSPMKREGLSSSLTSSSIESRISHFAEREATRPTSLDNPPSLLVGEGARGWGAIPPEKWHIPSELERRMQAIARELRKNPTVAEDKLWQAIRKRQLDGRKFRRQVAVGAFVLDFYCSSERLAVEVDGPIHDHQVEADKIRQELIESLGIRFVRLTNDDVENRLEAAIDKIRASFSPPSPGPFPHQEGRGAPMKRFVDEVAVTNPARPLASDPANGDESPLPHFGGGGLGVGAKPTKIVNLYENPATPADALGVARDIAEGKTEKIKGTVQHWSQERIAQGDWGGVQFLSPYLCEKFVELREDEFFAFRELGHIAHLGPAGQGVRGIFDRSEVPDKEAMAALWYHKTNITQKMGAQWDTYIKPKPGKAEQAADLWAKRKRMMIIARARLNTLRCASVRLNESALGSLWIPCQFHSHKYAEEFLEKAACAYLNSTLGLLAILGDRSNKIPSYPHFSMYDLRRVIMPDFDAMSASQVTALATAFDTLCNFTLLPLPQIMQDETRAALDRVVTDALDIMPEVVANIRRELSREPSITGKPYEA